MVFRRSHLSGLMTSRDAESRPRPRIPFIAAFVGALALMNVASAVLGMIK